MSAFEDEAIPVGVDWQNLKNASMISQDDLQLLTSIDSLVPDFVAITNRIEAETPSRRVEDFVKLFHTVLETISNEVIIVRLVYLLKNILQSSDKFFEAYWKSSQPFAPLVRHLIVKDNGNNNVLLYNLFLSIAMISTKIFESDKMGVFFNALKQILKLAEEEKDIGKSLTLCNVILKPLSVAMQRSENRRIFLDSIPIGTLLTLLKVHGSNIQVCYDVCFCLWTLSFMIKERQQFLVDVNVVASLHQVIRNNQKEKVIRIALMTLNNLYKDPKFMLDLISVGVPKTLLNLSRKTFDDDDINVMVKNMLEKTESSIDEMSTFEDYRQEVYSHQLDWTPCHTSTKFWQTNLEKFADNDYGIIKELIQILGTTRDAKTVLIAINDISQFLQFHKEGKQIISQFGGKSAIMKLMEEHPDEEVRSQALLCTQKIILQNWQFLQAAQ